MRIKLTPHQLASFLRLSETLNFGEAADSLGISQPGLSRTIRLMEDTLGMRLFDRDTRNMALTAAGHELRPIAERLVAEFDSAFGELAQFAQGHSGRVTIAALPSVAAMLLPEAVAEFRRQRPGVDFLIRDSLSEAVLSSVRDGVADLGLTVQPLPHEKLAYRPLLDDDFLLVCREDDPLARRDKWTWSVFEQQPFIAMSPTSSVRAMTDAAFLQTGLSVRPLFECSGLATLGNLIRVGQGISAVPRLTLPLLQFTGLAARPLSKPLMSRSIGIVTRVGRSQPPAARDFLQTLVRTARQTVV